MSRSLSIMFLGGWETLAGLQGCQEHHTPMKDVQLLTCPTLQIPTTSNLWALKVAEYFGVAIRLGHLSDPCVNWVKSWKSHTLSLTAFKQQEENLWDKNGSRIPNKWHLCMEPGAFKSYEIIIFFRFEKHKNQRCFPLSTAAWLLRGFLVGIILWHLSAGTQANF